MSLSRNVFEIFDIKEYNDLEMRKLRSLAYIFAADSMGLRSLIFSWWAPNRKTDVQCKGNGNEVMGMRGNGNRKKMLSRTSLL